MLSSFECREMDNFKRAYFSKKRTVIQVQMQDAPHQSRRDRCPRGLFCAL